MIGVGGCVASQEGDAILKGRTLCRSRFWSANLASLARYD